MRANLVQVLQQLLQVLFVGMTLGMMRTVVPALAESEFGVPRGSFMLLVAFVIGFGFVKGTMNFVAGHLAERVGRRSVLLIGWLTAVPIPWIIYFAPSWNWIVLATILLGVNQGLTWCAKAAGAPPKSTTAASAWIRDLEICLHNVHLDM